MGAQCAPNGSSGTMRLERSSGLVTTVSHRGSFINTPCSKTTIGPPPARPAAVGPSSGKPRESTREALAIEAAYRIDVDDPTDTDCAPELRRLGRTLGRWHVAIVNWDRARATNGP